MFSHTVEQLNRNISENKNLESIILIGFAYGLLTCILPVFIVIELYCYKKNQNAVNKPIQTGMVSGAVIGLLFLIPMMFSSSGESGLIGVVMAPFLILGYSVGGGIVGCYYWRNNSTILHQFKKRNSQND